MGLGVCVGRLALRVASRWIDCQRKSATYGILGGFLSERVSLTSGGSFRSVAVWDRICNPPCFGQFCNANGAIFGGHFGGCSLSTFLLFAAMHCKWDAPYKSMNSIGLCEDLRRIATPCKTAKY